MIEIKSWATSQVIYKADLPDLRAAIMQAVKDGADLYCANLRSVNLRSVNLYGVNLRSADLYCADLRSANLRSADLRDADLRDADLRDADLRDASLYGADLRSADLRGSVGIPAEKTTPLLMLLDQPGKIRAYKVVNTENEGHINGGLKYAIGETVEVGDACTDTDAHCGKGIHVATLDWCLKEWCNGYRILILEFEAKDIAAIPTHTDGKFRLHRAKVVGEKDISHLVRTDNER